MDPVVIVGASLAGLRAAQGVRAAGHEGELIVVGAEERLPYTRPPLSKELLAGEHEPAQCDFDCSVVEAEWRLGETAVALDDHRIALASGDKLPFSRAVFATGCRPRPWPQDVDGLHMLRDLEDSLALRSALTPDAHVVVVGAGFVGCEVAATARKRGAQVTLVDVAPHPLVPLGPLFGVRCARLHADHGVTLRLGVAVAGFLAASAPHAGDATSPAATSHIADASPPVSASDAPYLDASSRFEAVDADQTGGHASPSSTKRSAVELVDGSRIEADVIVVALGAIPNVDWLAGADLTLERGGVLCDATLTVAGHPDVLCAGDIVSWPHPLADGEVVRVEHWTNAAEQGAIAGRNAVAEPDDRAPYEAVPYFWTDQYDVKVQSAGFPALAERVEVFEEEDERLVAVGVRGDQAVAALAWNAPRRLMVYRRALAQRPTLAQLQAQIGADEKALEGVVR